MRRDHKDVIEFVIAVRTAFWVLVVAIDCLSPSMVISKLYETLRALPPRRIMQVSGDSAFADAKFWRDQRDSEEGQEIAFCKL